MIKSTTKKKINPKFLTYKEIKEELSKKGVLLTRNYEEGAYELVLKSDPSIYALIGFDTLDTSLDDVLEQGLKIAKTRSNPKKCRVIKVRRKISMGKGKRPRILQVRRKVCNPSKEIEKEINSLIDYDVFLWTTDSRNAKGKKLLLAGILEEVPSWDESKHYSVYNEYSGNEPYVFDIEDVVSIADDNILIRSIF